MPRVATPGRNGSRRARAARARRGLLGALVALTLAACTRTDASAPDGAATTAMATTTAPAPDDDGSVVSRYAGESWFLGEVPSAARPADPSLAPIRLGIINQEGTPVGSYSEVRAAVEAGAAWVNAELGGVNGHPIEIDPCLTPFDAAQSRACALELIARGAVAFVGGVDVLSGSAYPVIEASGLASFGGIPANLVEQRSPNALFFSGGDAGALAAFMAHIAQNGGSRVMLAYGAEVDSFAVAARDYGAAVGRSLGIEVDLTTFSLFTTDYRPVLAEAKASGADAVIVLAAVSACVPVMQAAADVQLEAQLYLTGACASETTIDAAGELAVGVVFNAEGPVDGADVEASLFQDVIDRYADEPAGGAGTVGFRGFMNLYALLLEAGAANATSETLIGLARASVDRPSFWGHPYTCDGDQVPGLPALCAPQQQLFSLPAVGARFAAVTGWIPTDELFADALG
jgi:branched-chain amino acid transport system substrate-binding protein